MKLYYILVLVLISFFSSTAVAADYGKGQSLPMDYEKLPQPIYLKMACNKVKIVEWRATPGYVNSTMLTKKAVNAVNDTCNLTVNNFYKFIDLSGTYNINKGTKLKRLNVSLSFIPADMDRHGGSPRSLNDFEYRFAYKSNRDLLWGFFQSATDWVYIRNDVLNDDEKTIKKAFIVVIAHELFHAMSYMSGVYGQHKPTSNRDTIDEKMAQNFTEWLLGSK